MSKRFKLRRGRSERMFTRGASRVHPRNVSGRPMRGGIRL
jgi:hypothetical protein